MIALFTSNHFTKCVGRSNLALEAEFKMSWFARPRFKSGVSVASMESFCEQHGMTVPVVQAPMAGGPTTPEMVAAVCNSGGLGSLGAEYLSPAQIEKDIARIRQLTQRSFAVNLFSPDADQPLAGDFAAVAAFLRPIHERLGIAPPEPPASPGENFEDQIDVLIRLKAPIISSTLGLFSAGLMERLKRQNIYVIGTATTVEEAKLLAHSGVDAITAQGSEAGGHRGTFTKDAEQALIGTMALVPQIVDAVKLPVLASGGIMDGRGIVAALSLGAAAAQMGTAFLACDESGASAAYRKALLAGHEDQTVITRAFSGRPARGLRNEFIDLWNQSGVTPMSFPWQNTLTRAMRRAGVAADDNSVLNQWTGQGIRMLRQGSATKIMNELRQEIVEALEAARERLPLALQ
jgi:nitronate monooxygenase